MQKQFDALEVALEFARSLRAPLERLKRMDRDLADQIRRAASSVALCVGEASRRDGKDRLHLFRVAAGSAHEVLAALSVAEAWGYIEPSAIAETRALIDRELAMLFRLVHPARHISTGE